MSQTSSPATFLFTDIEGSTRLWEEHPDAMPGAIEAHDALLRASVQDHGGVVIKTTGDGMLVRFDDPVAGLACAADGQRGLRDHPWGSPGPLRVRMALHAGVAQARDGDFFGPALNRAARLLAIGHGGQVLASAAVAALATDRLPSGLRLVDLGDHRLKDLEQPEHVYQVAAPDLPRDFPPLRSLGAGRTNLPIQLTSFVGRERELVEVKGLLEGHRLVTLIGVGGTGKTRLMLQAAAEAADRQPDGVWLTELAPIGDPLLVTMEVARSLGVSDQPGVPILTLLVDFLRAKEPLLVLDNCEHLVDRVAELAGRLLAAAPTLRILASSREALGVPGEVVFQVPSLGLPPVDAEHGEVTLGEVAGTEAVRLFVDRAMAVLPSFTLTDQNARAIAEICRRLDGIPLAIELAAARVTVLSVPEIVDRLGDRFRLLTGGRRTAVPRQQTLQALIDWSWDLLDEPDRRRLCRVSVFAGGWTLEAAAAVCSDAGTTPDAIDTLDGLGRLVERSLVAVDREDATRYRLLETIRQYARDRLLERRESEAIRARHLAFFEDLARQADPELRGPALVTWMNRLDTDADNIRAAIEWGLEADPEAAGRLCIAIWLHWRLRSNGSEGWAWLSRAVTRVRALPPPADAQAARERAILMSRLLGEAAFAGTTWAGRDTRAMAEEAVAIARAENDEGSLLNGLAALWTARYFRGDLEGLGALSDEQERLAEARGDSWALALAKAAKATALWATDPSAADELLRTAAGHARQTESPFAIAFVALNLGRLFGIRGKVAEMRVALGEAADAYGQLGDRRFVLVARSDLAHGLRRAGELDEAEELLRDTIDGWAHLGNRAAVANQLESVAFIAVARDRPARGARLLGSAEALREAADATMLPHERAEYDVALASIREAMDPGALDEAWRAGRADTMAAAIALAVEG